MTQVSEFVATVLLLTSSFILVWAIYRLRERRASIAKPESFGDYSGTAKDPDSLMEPNEEALEQLENLLR